MMLRYSLDNEWDKIKKSFYKYVTPKQTRKYENEQVAHIRPLIDVIDADKIINNSPLLYKTIRVLAQDTILNNYTLNIPDVLDEGVGDDELRRFNGFWNDKNKFQLYMAVTEYYKYGYAALEVRYGGDGYPVQLEQIPALSIRIRIQHFDGLKFCYIEQQINDDVKLLRISHSDESKGTDYSYLDERGIDDGSVGVAIWIGGGTINSWYSMPYWTSAKTSILTSIYIDELNYQKLSQGNVPSGVLLFEGNYRKRQGTESFENQLKRQLHNAGSGTAMIYLEGITPDSKIDTNYIKLEDDNYAYLSELKKECIGIILESFGVPKVRLMIDDITESMNSNKSDTIYEIYNKSIASEQVIFKEIINDFNEDELDITYDCVMDTPEFNDKTSVKITTIISLFEEGLLTLGQTVEYLSRLLPEVNFDSLMDSDEMKLSRYYKGSLLGSQDAMSPIQVDGIDETQELLARLESATNGGLFE